jgi:hypothetical protein
MNRRGASWLLPAALAVASWGLACAHSETESYGAAGAVPLGIADCDDGGDIYAGYGPCAGFIYGDYDQYPSFTPVARSEVTLTGDRQRSTHVVTRSGFGASSNDYSSPFGSSYSSSSDNSSTTTGNSSPTASTPRMDPVAIGAPAGASVVSRPH